MKANRLLTQIQDNSIANLVKLPAAPARLAIVPDIDYWQHASTKEWRENIGGTLPAHKFDLVFETDQPQPSIIDWLADNALAFNQTLLTLAVVLTIVYVITK